MKIKVIGPRDQYKLSSNAVFIDTTSKSTGWSRGLSPFFLGPCVLYNGFTSQNVENGWQYSKVYSCHVDSHNDPTKEYWKWAKSGWSCKFAQRYPIGKGKQPLYSLWNGKKLGYIEARSKIYVPLYSSAVRKSEAYKKLKELYQVSSVIYLWDFDGYDYEKFGMSLKDVLNDQTRKMGHAFVLAKMLEIGI